MMLLSQKDNLTTNVPFYHYFIYYNEWMNYLFIKIKIINSCINLSIEPTTN
jgi:hypothetical protein